MSAVVIIFSLLSTIGCLNGENVGLQSANNFPVANSANSLTAKGVPVENFQSRLLKSDLENVKIMGQVNADSFESKHHKSKKLTTNSEISRVSSVTESSTNSKTASSNAKISQDTVGGGSTTTSEGDTPSNSGDGSPATNKTPGENDSPEPIVPSLEPAPAPAPSVSSDGSSPTGVVPEKTSNPPDTPAPSKEPVKTPPTEKDKGEEKKTETDPEKEKTKPPVVKPPTKEDEKTTPPVVVTKPVVPADTNPEAEQDSSFSSMLYLVVGLAALFFAYRYFKQKFGGPASAQETAYSALPQTEDHGGDIELGSRGGKTNKGSDWEEWESDSDFPAETTNNTRHNVPAGITSTIAKPPFNQSFNTASGNNSNIGSTSIKKTSSNDYYKDSSPSTSNKSNRVSTPPTITPFRSTSADFNRVDSGSFDNLPTLDFVPPPAAAIGRLSAKTAAGKPSGSTPVKKSRSPAVQDVDLFASIGMSAAPKFREPVKAPEPAFQRPSGPSRVSAMAEEQEDSRGRSTWDEDQELDDLMGDD